MLPVGLVDIREWDGPAVQQVKQGIELSQPSGIKPVNNNGKRIEVLPKRGHKVPAKNSPPDALLSGL